MASSKIFFENPPIKDFKMCTELFFKNKFENLLIENLKSFPENWPGKSNSKETENVLICLKQIKGCVYKVTQNIIQNIPKSNIPIKLPKFENSNNKLWDACLKHLASKNRLTYYSHNFLAPNIDPLYQAMSRKENALIEGSIRELPGINTTILMEASIGSVTPLHIEDNFLDSALYVQKGGPKLILFVSRECRNALNNAISTELGLKECTNPLGHKLFIVSTTFLIKHNIQFVIKLVDANHSFVKFGFSCPHAVINLGNNCSYAINFASPGAHLIRNALESCKCTKDSSMGEPLIDTKLENKDAFKFNYISKAIKDRDLKFRCQKCEFYNSNKFKIYKHAQSKHKGLVCIRSCRLMTNSIHALAIHKQITHSKICKKCKARYLLKHNKCKEVSLVECQYCGQTFSNQLNVKQHQKRGKGCKPCNFEMFPCYINLTS